MKNQNANMVSFDDLIFKQWADERDYGTGLMEKPKVMPEGYFPWGKNCTIEFENDYGASIVRHHGSYGSKEGFYELAVLERSGSSNKWDLTYDTPITNDVKGWLTEDDVTKLLRQIQAL